jgi:hypothetical protein
MSKFIFLMNTKIRSFAFCLTACLLACSQSWAQRGPQDTWYETGSVAMPSSYDIRDLIITPEGTILLSDAGNDKIHELDENGSLIRSFGGLGSGNGQFDNPSGMAISQDNKIFVADSVNHRIQVLERNGTFVRKFGSRGDGNGQFRAPWGIALTKEGKVVVSELNANRIQVLEQNGTYIRKWGSVGTLEGQFNDPKGLDVDDSGDIYVADSQNARMCVFSELGEYKLSVTHSLYNSSSTTRITGVKVLPNGLIGTFGEYNFQKSVFRMREKNGDLAKEINFYWPNNQGGVSPGDQFKDGRVVMFDMAYKKLVFFKQTYRVHRPTPSKDAPLPEVISVTQPAGTNHLEIKYRITDADSAKVKAGLLAFKDGGNDLTKVIVPKTFVGSIAGKLDENTTTGTIHTVTWDAKTDWNVTYGDIEVAVVAQDDRDLMNFHFLTLPATDNNSTELKISRSPIVQSDFLNAWYTLLALGDEGITLENGQIKIVATGELGTQANGTQTNYRGRPYILDKMNLREATTAEITRAKEAATPGVTNQFEPAFKVGPGERPIKVNEYGFDTGTYGGSTYWVVPKN